MRIKSLDSLRGMAALVVVLHHCVWTYPDRIAWIKDTPLRIAFAGGSAVLVFFALSGFVLHLTFTAADKHQILPFLVKRTTRIYPAFAVATVLSWALYALVDPAPIPSLSAWFNHENWQVPPGAQVVAGHLAMTDWPDWQSLNNVMWSLVVEVRISVVFPLIAACVIANWRLALLVSFVLSVASGWAVDAHPTGWTLDPFRTVQYLDLFVGGAVLAQHRQAVAAGIDGLPRLHRIALWCAALALFAVPSNAAQGLPAGFGALLVVMMSFSDRRAGAVLTGPVQLWLGRVSYSLYLVHLPILLATVHLFQSQLPLLIVLLLGVALSLAAAEVMHRAVERPWMRLGRRLAAPRRPSPERWPVTAGVEPRDPERMAARP